MKFTKGRIVQRGAEKPLRDLIHLLELPVVKMTGWNMGLASSIFSSIFSWKQSMRNRPCGLLSWRSETFFHTSSPRWIIQYGWTEASQCYCFAINFENRNLDHHICVFLFNDAWFNFRYITFGKIHEFISTFLTHEKFDIQIMPIPIYDRSIVIINFGLNAKLALVQLGMNKSIKEVTVPNVQPLSLSINSMYC